MHLKTAVVTKVVVMVLGSRIGNPDEGVDANRVFAVFVLRDTADIERPVEHPAVINTPLVAHHNFPNAIEGTPNQFGKVRVGDVIIGFFLMIAGEFRSTAISSSASGGETCRQRKVFTIRNIKAVLSAIVSDVELTIGTTYNLAGRLTRHKSVGGVTAEAVVKSCTKRIVQRVTTAVGTCRIAHILTTAVISCTASFITTITRSGIILTEEQRCLLSSGALDVDSNVTHEGMLHIDADRADVGSRLHTTAGGELGEFDRGMVAGV